VVSSSALAIKATWVMATHAPQSIPVITTRVVATRTLSASPQVPDSALANVNWAFLAMDSSVQRSTNAKWEATTVGATQKPGAHLTRIKMFHAFATQDTKVPASIAKRLTYALKMVGVIKTRYVERLVSGSAVVHVRRASWVMASIARRT
jgi:hypothetical protein